jgi:hypothetical protein
MVLWSYVCCRCKRSSELVAGRISSRAHSEEVTVASMVTCHAGVEECLQGPSACLKLLMFAVP